MSFFTFLVFWFDEDLGGGEEIFLFFKKRVELKNGLLIFTFIFSFLIFFTFSFWNKKESSCYGTLFEYFFNN